MNGSKNDRSLYEFDGFRADPVRRRLSRSGEAVSLTPKAFSILLALLEKRGQVVPKEDLIQQIWPDTFVTEANLTQNISSLRKALGERANDPRYVVTVPGLGYSFVGDVLEVPRDATGEMPMPIFPPAAPAPLPAVTEEMALAAPAAPGSLHSDPVPIDPSFLEDTLSLLPPAPEVAVAPARRGPRPAVLALVLLVLASACTLLFYLYRPAASVSSSAPATDPPSHPDRAAVAVLGFTNLSGNVEQAWLSNALTQMLNTDLKTGGKVRPIPVENGAGTRAALVLPETAKLRTESLERLHLLGADLVVLGSFLSLGETRGGKIRLDVQVLRAPSGETVATLSELGTESDLFDLASRVGAGVRSALGWAPPSAAQTRQAQALQPTNPEAFRLYTEGLERLHTFDPQGARALFVQAAEADPTSAVIHSALAQAWAELGYDARATAEAGKAVELSGPLSKQEQLAIAARFAESKRDWNKASEIYRSLWTFFSDDLEYGLRLANALTEAGRVPEALETVAALHRLPAKTRDDPRIDLAEAQAARRLWDPERGAKAAKAAEIKGWKQGESQVVARSLAFQGQSAEIQGRLDEALALFQQARALFDKSGNQAEVAKMLFAGGIVLDDQGLLSPAQKQFEEGLAIARRLGSNTLAANQLCGLGLVQEDRGDLAQARLLFEQADKLYIEVGDRASAARARGFLGRVLDQQGDMEGARKRYEEMLSLISGETGRWVQEAIALDGLGQILLRQGQFGAARRSHEQALALAQKLKDPYRTAIIQTSLGEVAAREGDLDGAQRQFEVALATQHRLGDRLPAARILGSLTELAYRRGDLVKAGAGSTEQLGVARDTGARLLRAEALQNLSRTEIARGELAGARQHLETALETAANLGGQLAATAIRLDLARLALVGDRPADAVRLSREAADWYGRQRLPGEQARAFALLAEGLAQQGQLAQARDPAERARALADRSEDGDVQIAVTTSVARVDAAAGAVREAQGHLRWAVEQAAKAGLVPAGLEARLALGTVNLLSAADRSAGLQLLEALRREAADRGFKLLASRVELALKAGTPGARLLG